jgi:glucose/arabinose dehydrogenase
MTRTRAGLLLAGTLATLILTGPALAQQTPSPPRDFPAAGATETPVAPGEVPPPTRAEPTTTGQAPSPPPSPPAQGQARPPLPPGSPLIGQPDTEGAKKLAPIAPPPIPTAADKLPVNKLKLPKGFKVEVFASGVHNARSLRQGSNGTVFVGSRLVGKVHALVEKDGKRDVKVLLEGLHRPNGLAFHNGSLYVAELSKVWRYDDIEKNLDKAPQPKLIYDQLPTDEPHGWKFIGIGPDNKLYIPVGAPCNICMPPDTHAQIRRINLDGSGMEVVARGVRNTVGFDWHPVSKELYFTDNGRDWMSEDVPEEELNRVTQIGQHFGFPFCHQGNLRDTEFGWGRGCEDTVKPIALLGPHAAVLGMRFYTGEMFPKKYRNAIFIARHGAWNRSEKVGGDVVVAYLNRDGSVKSWEPFMTGFVENNNYLGRPVDVHVMPDGSLLVSDDFNGAVYRVSYASARTAAR